MNQMNTERRAQVIRCLVEGNSIRATVRMTGAAKNTVAKLLVEIGRACLAYHDANVRGLKCETIQVDEIWAFVGCKEANVKGHTDATLAQGRGDAWTWTALDADTKLIVSFATGGRNGTVAHIFMQDVKRRLTNRVQLTSDGHKAYLRAVESAFKGEVDYAQLQKIYGKTSEGQRRYSPPLCLGATAMPVTGNPDPLKISTSYVERQNLTMRMSMRRFTRLTNAFSKKLDNHEYAIALHFMYYNFCRKHQTLKTTPAVAAGLADHVWSIEELVNLLESN